MTKDIVNRLREWAEEDVRAIARDMPVMGLKIEAADVRRWGDLMDEAAKEIERLREALPPDHPMHPNQDQDDLPDFGDPHA